MILFSNPKKDTLSHAVLHVVEDADSKVEWDNPTEVMVEDNVQNVSSQEDVLVSGPDSSAWKRIKA